MQKPKPLRKLWRRRQRIVAAENYTMRAMFFEKLPEKPASINGTVLEVSR
jgi:hypothetical protein